MTAPAERLRLDKWLWRARFYKTRALAAEAVENGKLRVNGARVAKPGHGVKLGDVLSFPKAGRAHVVEILAFGERRGPAAEAALLYRNLQDDAEAPESAPKAEENSGAKVNAVDVKRDVA